ncbi:MULTISPECIES: HPr family phosphocarrier protein [Actinomadura]|uniref:Phosphocarrier protein HPr n=1 Tax=Actinomadura litoris TaxID=2678616 RepID=A0A7K1KWR2_9ACTN|nr:MULTISPECIES: HPr family phosphocarrier protein [Actinomadura]MBT2210738.1 HPr family phosphocarrier protein [Actinomadura sp. NEAU-AAG7]MUN36638.1 HPr family phosphocarrier protein [Actinomadura litoris]
MTERTIKIMSRVGLHARPAALFVQTAAKAPGQVTVAKRGAGPVNAKSILAVLGLDARHGEEIVIAADGEGADALLDTLEGLLSTPEPEGV